MGITNAELKKLVAYGVARDLTDKKISPTMYKSLTRVLTVNGASGIIGALYYTGSGRLYVATNRSTVLSLPH